MGQTPSHPPATDTESKPESESDGSSPSPPSSSNAPAAGQPSDAPVSEIDPNESVLALSEKLDASLDRALALQLDMSSRVDEFGASLESVNRSLDRIDAKLDRFIQDTRRLSSNLHDSIRRRSLEDDDDDLGASPSSSSSSSDDSHTENDDSHAVEDLHDQDEPGGGTGEPG